MLKIPKPTPARRSNPSVEDHSYNPDAKTLDITFHGNRRYRYHDVTARQYEALQSAPSIGGFLHAHIIGKCDATRLDD